MSGMRFTDDMDNEWNSLKDRVLEAWGQASSGFFVQGMSPAQLNELSAIAVNVISEVSQTATLVYG